jgi:hypothetical protein
MLKFKGITTLDANFPKHLKFSTTLHCLAMVEHYYPPFLHI